MLAVDDYVVHLKGQNLRGGLDRKDSYQTTNSDLTADSASDDAESFHSAITDSGVRLIGEGTHQNYRHASQPRGKVQAPYRNPPRLIQTESGLSCSPPRRLSTRTSRFQPRQSVAVPRRSSSVTFSENKQRSRRPDLLSLHSQSCQLFCSLDGTLAQFQSVPSRVQSPSSSPKSSRSTTRRTSIGADCNSLTALPVSSPHLMALSNRLEATLAKTEGPRSQLFQSSSPASSACETPPQPQPPATFTQHPTLPDTNADPVSGVSDPQKPTEQQPQPPPLPNSVPPSQTLIWTSTATRRKEYAKIDAAHSGVRGFAKKMLPKPYRDRWCGARRNFSQVESGLDREAGHGDDGSSGSEKKGFGPAKDESEAGSVRRYRVSLDDDDEDLEDGTWGAREKRKGERITIQEMLKSNSVSYPNPNPKPDSTVPRDRQNSVCWLNVPRGAPGPALDEKSGLGIAFGKEKSRPGLCGRKKSGMVKEKPAGKSRKSWTWNCFRNAGS